MKRTFAAVMTALSILGLAALPTGSAAAAPSTVAACTTWQYYIHDVASIRNEPGGPVYAYVAIGDIANIHYRGGSWHFGDYYYPDPITGKLHLFARDKWILSEKLTYLRCW